MYIVCEDSSATVTASSASVLLVSGGRSSVAGQNIVFDDVPESSWYYDYVYAAVALGLIDGITENGYGRTRASRSPRRSRLPRVCTSSITRAP